MYSHYTNSFSEFFSLTFVYFVIGVSKIENVMDWHIVFGCKSFTQTEFLFLRKKYF